jgi:RecB family exonuclease
MDSGLAKGVTLLLGPPNSGKRGLVLDWWQERLVRLPVVVMPTALDAQDMTAEMARRTSGVVGQSPAVTFAGLAQLVIGRECRFADDFERALLVWGVLQGAPASTFAGLQGLPGLTDAAATLLLELKGSGRRTEDIQAVLEQWALEEPGAAGVVSDIGGLLDAYTRALSRWGLVDQPTAVTEAARLTDGWHRPVAFWGFASFTRGQRVLMTELSRRTEVLVVLTHERKRGVGLCAPEEAEWWFERASNVLDLQSPTRAYASPALAYLERAFLEGQHPSVRPVGEETGEGIHFLLASGRHAEAELTAKHVAALIREGVDPGGIAVVVRQMRAWVGLLGDVFTSCGIPWQADARSHLAETGLGYAFLSALKGVALSDVEPLLSFLRSPYSGVSLEEVSRLETRYRRGMERGTDALTALADGGAEEALRSVQALVTGAVPAEIGADARTVDLAAALALAECMLVAGAKAADVGSRELEDDARAFRYLGAALRKMADMAGQAEGSVAGRLAPEAASEVRLSDCLHPQAALNLLARVGVSGPTCSDPGTVQIMSAKRARARRFEVVFILGLVEGEFPGASEVASLLSAGQKRSLDQVGGGLFAPAEETESTLFVGAASRAWRSLYLSARDAEDDGGEAVPSRFWREAKTVLGVGETGHDGRTLADQVFSPETAPTLRHYLRACAHLGGPSPSEERDGVTSETAPAWRRLPDRLVSAEVLAELKSAERFSPSSLEAYVRCPFAWFIQRVIGAEELESGLDGRVIGELIHQALSECYRSLAADGHIPLQSGNLAQAEKTADVIIDRLVRGPACPGSPAERLAAGWLLRSMAQRVLRMEALGNGLLRFAEAEKNVGGPDGVDIGGIRVRGRIDRLDRTPDCRGVFVFDYKSGAAPAASAIGTSDGLQLPLYLMALGAEHKEVDVIGGAYLSLREGKLVGVVGKGEAGLLGSWPGRLLELDEDGWDRLFRDAREIALAAAAGMRSGLIAPPSERSCPRWCDLGPACRSCRSGGP